MGQRNNQWLRPVPEPPDETYGLMLQAPTSAQSALAGATVTYTLQLTNTGSTLDSFSVQVADAAPYTVTLAAGEMQTLAVAVRLPPEAVPGISLLTDVSVTSQSDAAQTQLRTLTTRVSARLLYLPFVGK